MNHYVGDSCRPDGHRTEAAPCSVCGKWRAFHVGTDHEFTELAK